MRVRVRVRLGVGVRLRRGSLLHGGAVRRARPAIARLGRLH